MPITARTDHPNDLTTLTVEGAVTLEDLSEAVCAFRDRPPARKILWDFRNASTGDAYAPDDLKQLASVVKKNMNVHPNGKTAFVANTDLEFGLIRMYMNYWELQSHGNQIDAFRSFDDALRWLGIPKP